MFFAVAGLQCEYYHYHCRTTMWYWASCPVWRCRSADANSPNRGHHCNLNFIIFIWIVKFGILLHLVAFRVDFVADNQLLLFPSLYSNQPSTHNWALHNWIISWHIEHIDRLDNWSIMQTMNWLITWLGISQFPIWSGTVRLDLNRCLFFVTVLIMWDENWASNKCSEQLRKL